MCQLGHRSSDLGQMIAEMYELTLYKDTPAGVWLIEGFAAGYGQVDDEFVLRTICHTGVHLISMGSNTPGWGTPEQAEQVAKEGRDVLTHAWKKDRSWFASHPLNCLFSSKA